MTYTCGPFIVAYLSQITGTKLSHLQCAYIDGIHAFNRNIVTSFVICVVVV